MGSTDPGVLFDIDGTLVDSNYLHVVAWWRAFDELGYQVSMASIHHRVGMGSDKLLPELIGRYDADADRRHSELYRELHPWLRAFPGAGELLRAVKRAGARVVLATSAKSHDLHALLGAIDADDAIDEVTSAGDVDESKPAPNLFAVAMDAGHVDADRAVVVGDTVWDIEAAGSLGLPCVCVETGGVSRELLEGAGARAVYANAEALLDDLGNGPVGRILKNGKERAHRGIA